MALASTFRALSGSRSAVPVSAATSAAAIAVAGRSPFFFFFSCPVLAVPRICCLIADDVMRMRFWMHCHWFPKKGMVDSRCGARLFWRFFFVLTMWCFFLLCPLCCGCCGGLLPTSADLADLARQVVCL